MYHFTMKAFAYNWERDSEIVSLPLIEKDFFAPDRVYISLPQATQLRLIFARIWVRKHFTILYRQMRRTILNELWLKPDVFFHC